MRVEVRMVHGQGTFHYAHEMLAEWTVHWVGYEFLVVLHGVPVCDGMQGLADSCTTERVSLLGPHQ